MRLFSRTPPVAAPVAKPSKKGDGAFVSLADLAALQLAARDFSLRNSRPVRDLISGRRDSHVRGRSLAFEEMRQYLPGDDVRAIDWRATARTGKPFVRVYDEEKDRPVLLVVDQRRNMFFGTRRAMKSVAAAEAAALVAWRSIAEGDRIGGFVFNDAARDEARPNRSRASVMRLMAMLAARNRELRESSSARAPGRLDEALEAAAALARHDHLVVLISDLDGHGPRTRDLLLRLVQSNDVLVFLVYDPFLLNLPTSGEIVAGDGALQVQLGFGVAKLRRGLADFADARTRDILSWRSELGVTVLPLSSAEETAAQMRRLLAPSLRRRRM